MKCGYEYVYLEKINIITILREVSVHIKGDESHFGGLKRSLSMKTKSKTT